MMPTTPSGTRTRWMRMPFGRVHSARDHTIGSARRNDVFDAFRHRFDSLFVERQPIEHRTRQATIFRLLQIDLVRRKNRRRWASNCAAAAFSAAFFCAVVAWPSARAASTAARPMRSMRAAISEGALVAAFMGRLWTLGSRKWRPSLALRQGVRQEAFASLRQEGLPASKTENALIENLSLI